MSPLARCTLIILLQQPKPGAASPPDLCLDGVTKGLGQPRLGITGKADWLGQGDPLFLVSKRHLKKLVSKFCRTMPTRAGVSW
ncbi:hypothetical protein EDB81DRAFT_811377 [Dactylonectria macrodidyma]|uniref:Secreted protein n=1 Tax=Dactylonectria macrodidyma TaxID=307937 RepID=A0A9P9DRR1_9HYPO|nr:hypothetical protein EDB81DRAFT_811377 [Dactylonectria macrodidyma]